MNKRTTACNAGLAALLSGAFSASAGAATFYSALDNALGQDHLLHDAALQQQSHTPLIRMPRHDAGGHDAGGHDAVADPDAIYVQYDQGDSEHAGVAGEADIALRNPLMLTGGEYQVSPQWLLGANLGQLDQSLTFADSDDSIQTRLDLATVYARWGKNGFTATTLAGYQQGELESTRTIENGRPAQSETDIRQRLFSLGGRYSFEEAGWRYGPFSRLDLSEGNIKAHEEITNDALTAWQTRRHESRIFSMGVHGTYLVHAGAGSIAPYFTLATRKELHNKRDMLSGRSINGDVVTELSIDAAERDERWHEATLGLRLALEDQLLINAEFAQALDLHHQDLQSLSVRADWIFKGL